MKKRRCHGFINNESVPVVSSMMKQWCGTNTVYFREVYNNEQNTLFSITQIKNGIILQTSIFFSISITQNVINSVSNNYVSAETALYSAKLHILGNLNMTNHCLMGLWPIVLMVYLIFQARYLLLKSKFLHENKFPVVKKVLLFNIYNKRTSNRNLNSWCYWSHNKSN